MKFKDSIRFKLILLIFSLMAGSFLIYLFLNKFFLQDYYLRTKEKSMIRGYEKINEVLSEETPITTEKMNSVAKTCEKYGITMIVVDTADTIEMQFGNAEVLRHRLQEINFKPDDRNTKIIKKTNKYTLQSYYRDDNQAEEYLEITGFFNKKTIFLMRMAVENIKESVSISNQFFIYTGMVVCVISIIFTYFISVGFTKPIMDIANISKEMSKQNFEIKYTGDSKDEIGVLGRNMNEMSEKLESAFIELKQANYRLTQDIKKKEEVDKMRKEFISNVSHELKTPISLIQGYSEGLKECVNDDEESRNFYCDVILDEASKMNRLVKSLLLLNQIEYGGNELQYEKFDIGLVVNGVIQKLDYMLKQKNICVEYEYTQNYVYADEFKIEEVITNYMTNAINHIGDVKKIIVSFVQNNDKLRINVFNYGERIPEEEIDNIWIKFYKVDKARTREYGGSGIGLSIVQAIMEAHGNKCGVENMENGVNFWFEVDIEFG